MVDQHPEFTRSDFREDISVDEPIHLQSWQLNAAASDESH